MRTLFPRFRPSTHRPWLAALILVLASGCLGDAVSPEQAARLRPVSGGEQVALLGEAVDEPLRVRVEDASGNPLRGVEVEWRVAAGGGSVDALRTATDGEGIASVRWTLGSVAGEQRVEARAGRAPALVFLATATEVSEFRLSPRHVRLGAVGDEQVLRLLTRDTDGGDVASGVVTWVSTDPSIVAVFGGRLTATGTGATTVVAMSDGGADTVLVSVGISSTAPVVVTGTGQQRTSPSELRIAGTAAGNGYAGESWLEWGRQPDLSDAAELARGALAATGTRGMAGSVTGLALGETVYFRAAAQTSQGLVRGAIVPYTVAPPGQPTGLATHIASPNYLLKLTWTVPERAYSYAAERREPGETAWTSTSLFTSNTGGYWAYYPTLHEARTVEYRVRSCNAVGCTWSDVVQAAIPRLDPPSGLAAAVTDSGHVRLTWADVPHETSWAVYRRIEGNPEAAQFLGTAARNAPAFTDRTVLPGVTYLYSVSVSISFGGRSSPRSGEVAATVGGGQTYPPTASTLEAIQPTSPTSVTLRGTADPNHFAGHVWMEWGLQPDLSDAAVVGRDTLPAEGTKAISGVVTGLSSGTTIYFRAVAENRYATVRGAIRGYTVALPELPTALRAEFNPPSFRLNLFWTPGARTASYYVEQRDQGETAWRSTSKITSGPGGAWYEYPPMTHTRTVEYRIRACNAVGCVYGAPILFQLQRLEPPQNTAATVNAAKDVVLSWSAYPTATSFQVLRRVHGDAAPAGILGGTNRYATGYTDTTALEGVTYVYTVRSLLTPGSRVSVPSPELFVTPGSAATYPPTATTGKALQPIDEVAEPDPTIVQLNGTAMGNNFAGHVWFEWSPSPDMTGATVLARDTLPAAGTKTLRTYLGGRTPGSTIYYRMVAENRYATVRGAVVGYTVAPPEPATALRVEYGVTPNLLLKLYWTPHARSTGYAVEHRDQGAATWTSTGLYTVNGGGYWAFYPTLDHTRTIEIRVQSCNTVGCTYSAPVTQLIQRFDPPTGLSGSVNGAGDVVLTWTDAALEGSYEIFRGVHGNPDAAVKIGTAAKNATTFTDVNAVAGTTYVYTVRGFLSTGSRRSDFSNEAVVPVP